MLKCFIIRMEKYRRNGKKTSIFIGWAMSRDLAQPMSLRVCFPFFTIFFHSDVENSQQSTPNNTSDILRVPDSMIMIGIVRCDSEYWVVVKWTSLTPIVKSVNLVHAPSTPLSTRLYPVSSYFPRFMWFVLLAVLISDNATIDWTTPFSHSKKPWIKPLVQNTILKTMNLF